MTLRSAAWAALAGQALAVLLLVGCSGAPSINTGPFGNGEAGGPSGTCSPEINDRVYTAGGIASFRNTGPEAVIDTVSLAHPHLLRLLAAYAVTITGYTEYGNWDGYPAPHDVSAGVQWAHRQRADGAQIPPARVPHDHTDLVLIIKLLGKTGTSNGVNVFYHTPDHKYHLYIDNALKLSTAREISKCPV